MVKFTWEKGPHLLPATKSANQHLGPQILPWEQVQQSAGFLSSTLGGRIRIQTTWQPTSWSWYCFMWKRWLCHHHPLWGHSSHCMARRPSDAPSLLISREKISESPQVKPIWEGSWGETGARLKKISEDAGLRFGGPAKLVFFHCTSAPSDIICQTQKISLQINLADWHSRIGSEICLAARVLTENGRACVCYSGGSFTGYFFIYIDGKHTAVAFWINT